MNFEHFDMWEGLKELAIVFINDIIPKFRIDVEVTFYLPFNQTAGCT